MNIKWPTKKRFPLYVDTHEREDLFALFKKKCKDDKVTAQKRLWALINMYVQTNNDINPFEDILDSVERLEKSIKEWRKGGLDEA